MPLNFRVLFLHAIMCSESVEREKKSGTRETSSSSSCVVVALSRSVLEATEICLLFLQRGGRASR